MDAQPTTKSLVRFYTLLLSVAILLPLMGCGPNYYDLRREGQHAMISGAYGPAKIFFSQANGRVARRVENLHDLGACSVMIARKKFKQSQRAAAMRELDDAVEYYSTALDVHPGHQASIEGKMVALKLKGQFDKAIGHAEWAAKFVGPSSTQYLFLASELEERKDDEGALLRYRQAVAVDPRNSEVHIKFADFLLRHNNEPAAIHHLQVAYRIDPLNKWVTDQLANRGALPTLALTAQPKP